ncbi:cDNA sequence BC050196, isoform CRA_b [Mus musculus]|nr:cDNA sequence BC050196, isoform CRA_b [Mus musculus]
MQRVWPGPWRSTELPPRLTLPALWEPITINLPQEALVRVATLYQRCTKPSCLW